MMGPRRILVGLAVGLAVIVALPTTAAHAAPPAPGAVSLTPSSVRAASTHDFFFRYQAPTSQGVSASISFRVPPNWTRPQLGNATAAGFVAIGARSCQGGFDSALEPSSDGSTTISVGVRCQPDQFFTVKYLAATAPTKTASNEFTAMLQIGFSVVPFAIQPTVDVTPGGSAALIFTTEPQKLTVAGDLLSPAPTVRVVDAYGNPTGSSARVTIGITTNPAAGTLSGTTTVTASAGVATFAGLSIDKAGRIYILSANAVGLTSTSSTGFTVVPAPLDRLVISSDTNTIAAGGSATYRAQGIDAFGNPRGKVTAVTFTIAPDGSCVADTCMTTTAGDHVVTGTTASKTGTALLHVKAGPPVALAFSDEPSTTAAGAHIIPAPTVLVTDAYGNRTESEPLVTVALGTIPAGATLSGTTRAMASSGLAAFHDLSINKAGSGYTLSATSVRFTTATSTSFDVVP